jgi:YidC/Oxa1 family membrane protein insertase
LHLLLATNWLLDPIVALLNQIVGYINIPLHNLGLSLVVLAALIRAVFWVLNAKQFKSMIAMQKIAPRIKALQEKYKNDQQKLQQETMALYKSEGVNPLAGCLPLLIQYPFIISVFYMVLQHKKDYDNQHFLWVGSLPATVHVPMIFNVPLIGSSLAQADASLLVLYALSMYVSVRFGSMPATDPAQAQTQKMMAFLSPAMLFYVGFRFAWPSAMVLYWLSSNVFQMAQQFYMLRRYHEPLSFIDSAHAITQDVQSVQLTSGNGGNGASKRSKKKKGAKS